MSRTYFVERKMYRGHSLFLNIDLEPKKMLFPLVPCQLNLTCHKVSLSLCLMVVKDELRRAATHTLGRDGEEMKKIIHCS